MILKKAAEADALLARPPADLRACLIHGRDRGGVRERAGVLAAALNADPDDPFTTASLTESDIEAQPARLAEDLSALSFLGGRRVVRLRLSGERIAADRIAAEAMTLHLAGSLNPEAFLLIESGALAGGSPLRKVAEGGGRAVAVIPVYEDETGDLMRLTRDALSAAGVRLTPEALQLFASRLPGDRGVARQEIERLTLFVGPDAKMALPPEALTDFFGVEADASLADAASDAFGAKPGPALSNLRRAMAEGEGAVAAVAAASRHLQRLRRIGIAQRGGANLGAALKSSGVFWKQEREVGRQVGAWSVEALDTVQARILEADTACKSTGSPEALLAERLYLGIAATARRAGL